MKNLLSIVLVLTMVFGITAFECGNKNLSGAKIYMQNKQYDKAIELLNTEIQANPQNAEAYYLLGQLHGEKENVTAMIENFNKSLKISDKFKNDIDNDKLAYWSDNFNKGVAFYNRSQKTTKEDSVKLWIGRAEQAFKTSIVCAPDSSVSYLNLAYAQFSLDKKDDAITSLVSFVKLKPDADAYIFLGQLLTEKEKYDDVEKYMTEARTKFPENSDILGLYSNALIATNKLDLALNTFKAGVESEPENKLYRYNYGTILMNAEKFEEAILHLEKAIQIDPEYINAMFNLAVTHVKFGTKLREEAEEKQTGSTVWKTHFEKSLPFFEKYLAATPNDVNIWEFLGKVYANLGMTEKSAEAFKKADELR